MTADTSSADPLVLLPAAATASAALDRFTGQVWVDRITDGAGPGHARLATVRFSPGARTAWHVHAHGQTLHVTDGLGFVQTRDGRTLRLRAGDTVYTPPGVWHWHGAAPDRFMTHLALSDTSADLGDHGAAPDVTWGEHLTDADYAAATAAAGITEGAS